jgi:hypothetical protein
VYIAFIITRATGHFVYIHRKLMDMNVYSSIEIIGTNTKSYIFITKGEVSKRKIMYYCWTPKTMGRNNTIEHPKTFCPKSKITPEVLIVLNESKYFF